MHNNPGLKSGVFDNELIVDFDTESDFSFTVFFNNFLFVLIINRDIQFKNGLSSQIV